MRYKKKKEGIQKRKIAESSERGRSDRDKK